VFVEELDELCKVAKRPCQPFDLSVAMWKIYIFATGSMANKGP
jgi:hypothetical protein